MRKLAVYGCAAMGMWILYRSMFVGFGISMSGVVFGLLVVAGAAMASRLAGVAKPPVPADFAPAYWNRNIALDTTSGALWIRDQGRKVVLRRDEVVGWEMQNSNFSSTAMVGPRVTPMDNRLLVKTKNLDRPVWTVRFDAHSSLFGAGNHQNHKELKTWYERLNAFYNHTPAT